MPWVYYILMLIVQIAGMFLSIVGLPGIWLMVLAVSVFAWLTRAHQFVSPGWLVAMAVIAGISEIVELLASGAGAKKAGATKKGMLGAILGGIIGAIFLTALIPIPIIGTIIGVCLGAGLGALTMEIFGGKQIMHATQIGVGAAKGRFLGIVSKLIFCGLIFLLSVIAAFPVGGKSQAAATVPPASLPSTP